MNYTEDYERIEQIVKELEPELKKLALKIHDHPEGGHQEFKACQWQTELLKKYGFSVMDHFCNMPTAYKAVYQGTKQGPRIAMLAEYDALKKIGHGCGHNLIAMVGTGSGIAMREFADKYGGEIVVIGTPAEETDGAKVAMAEQGAFDDCDVVMMAHPSYEFTDSLATSAVMGVTVEFFGKAAHAANSPEQGENALDAMISFYNLISMARQRMKDHTRIHGIITNGGVESNTIPDYTAAEFLIRAPRMSGIPELYDIVCECARGAAAATRTRENVKKMPGTYMDTHSNQVLNKIACGHMEELGAKIRYSGGAVHQGSSDVGNVSYRCPVIQLKFKIGDPPEGASPASGHSLDFAEKAASDTAINNGLMYVKGFVRTAIDLMTQPELCKEIREEFLREIPGRG